MRLRALKEYLWMIYDIAFFPQVLHLRMHSFRSLSLSPSLSGFDKNILIKNSKLNSFNNTHNFQHFACILDFVVGLTVMHIVYREQSEVMRSERELCN